MSKKILQGETHFHDGKNHVNVKLSLIEFEEDGNHFVYSPALDLTGYGKTEEHAKESFNFVMEEFLTYATNKNTLTKELKRLGWEIKNKKKVTSPTLPALIQNRDYLVEIFTEKEYRKVDRTVSLPAFA